MLKVLVVFGTRPEAIKMAPLVLALQARENFKVSVCVTGQHRAMLDQVLSVFSIEPDFDLAIMRPNQDLTDVTVRTLNGLRDVLADEKPDWVLVHGDTTTAMAASLAAFFAGCRIGHVEAGLRTGDMRRPWPEEMNRAVIDRISDLYFAPTDGAQANLIRENLNPNNVLVTGNTVIDALLYARQRIETDEALRSQLEAQFPFVRAGQRFVLVTGHRRESFGDGFLEICKGIARIADRSDCDVVYPVHLNPNVREPVLRLLSGRSNVHLIEPQEYLSFVYLMLKSHIILTDSGGVQEEAPSLGKPVLVMRDVTERPEAVSAGTAKLVGARSESIYQEVANLLDDAGYYARFAQASNPYGDGRASQRIVAALDARANDAH